MRQPKEIEFAFLGCIFDNPPTRIPDALKVKANADWFSDQTCKLAWVAIDTLRKKTSVEKIRPLVIIEEATQIANRKKSPFYGVKITPQFIDDAKRYRDAAEENEETTIEAYAPILQEAAIGRKLNEAMDSARTEGKFSSNTVRMMELAKQIQRIQKEESPDSGVDISNLLDNMTEAYKKGDYEYRQKHNYNYVPGIPFPWENVSRITKGLNPGLHIIAARPSVGKTSFILQCMLFWCEMGYKVAFDCLDMSVTEMIKRPVANLSMVSPTRMEFGWAKEDEKAAVAAATEKMRNISNNGLFSVTVEPDVDKLKAWAEIRHKAGKLDILVIDFAQRFRMKGTSSEYEIVTYAAGVLKQLSNECLMPVVLLSQLSRDNEKDKQGPRPPELSDLRGSGALEQDATSVVLMHKVQNVNAAWKADPPMYYIRQTEDTNLNVENAGAVSAVVWNMAKNQNGPTGRLPFVTFQNYFRWYVGDNDADKEEQFYKIKADWRFFEEPFVTAERNGCVKYPEFWEQKCSDTCGRLGVSLPERIKSRLTNEVLDRYYELRREHDARMQSSKDASVVRLETENVSPSIANMTEEAKKVEKIETKDLNNRMQIAERMISESEAGNEPLSDQFDDDDF